MRDAAILPVNFTRSDIMGNDLDLNFAHLECHDSTIISFKHEFISFHENVLQLVCKEDLVDEIWKVAGYVRASAKKERARLFINDLLADLFRCRSFRRDLSFGMIDSASKYQLSRHMIRRLVRSVMHCGYVEVYRPGFSLYDSEVGSYKGTGRYTRIRPSDKCLFVIDAEQCTYEECLDPIYVTVKCSDKSRTRSKNGGFGKDCGAEELKEYYELVKNRTNIYMTPPQIKKIMSRDSLLGGRFYHNLQQLSKEDRKLIRLDGEETIELDFSNNHLKMFLAMTEEDALEEVDLSADLYEGFGMNRKDTKIAINAWLNCRKPEKFFTDRRYNSKFRWTPEQYQEFEDKLFKKYSELRFVKGESIGLFLQYLEGIIGLNVCHALITQVNIPVINIHDSFICKVSDQETVLEAMNTFWDYYVRNVDRRFLDEVRRELKKWHQSVDFHKEIEKQKILKMIRTQGEEKVVEKMNFHNTRKERASYHDNMVPEFFSEQYEELDMAE